MNIISEIIKIGKPMIRNDFLLTRPMTLTLSLKEKNLNKYVDDINKIFIHPSNRASASIDELRHQKQHLKKFICYIKHNLKEFTYYNNNSSTPLRHTLADINDSSKEDFMYMMINLSEKDKLIKELISETVHISSDGGKKEFMDPISYKESIKKIFNSSIKLEDLCDTISKIEVYDEFHPSGDKFKDNIRKMNTLESKYNVNQKMILNCSPGFLKTVTIPMILINPETFKYCKEEYRRNKFFNDFFNKIQEIGYDDNKTIAVIDRINDTLIEVSQEDLKNIISDAKLAPKFSDIDETATQDNSDIEEDLKNITKPKHKVSKAELENVELKKETIQITAS